MAKKEIHELSYEELVLYKKQLETELSKVNFRLNQYKKAEMHTDLVTEIPSQVTNEGK